MPYLHWQTDSERVQSATAIKDATSIKPSIAEVVAENQRSKKKFRAGWWSRTNSRHRQSSNGSATANPIPESTKRSKLRLVLLQAAALVQAIDFRVEENLITKYLHERQSLHPRRTLDQSYYGALKDTRARDQDQVVYRATTRTKHGCPLRANQDTQPEFAGCEQCQKDIGKSSRLIVVDQLWMWILDESTYYPNLRRHLAKHLYGRLLVLLSSTDTVITSFPRRWGKNKPDPLSVHKTLRIRLKAVREGEICSAYDLGLIIIDECSRVLFDRTRGIHLKPDPINCFADAIREIVS